MTAKIQRDWKWTLENRPDEALAWKAFFRDMIKQEMKEEAIEKQGRKIPMPDEAIEEHKDKIDEQIDEIDRLTKQKDMQEEALQRAEDEFHEAGEKRLDAEIKNRPNTKELQDRERLLYEVTEQSERAIEATKEEIIQAARKIVEVQEKLDENELVKAQRSTEHLLRRPRLSATRGRPGEGTSDR